MARKKETPAASTNGTPSSTEVTNGEATPNGTSGPQNGDASSSSDQTYSAHVSGSGAEDESGGGNGYAYVNGYTNGYSYGGGYHMDQGGAVPNGGAYFVNGGSYELYDPYAAAAAAAAAAAGYAFPYVGAPPPHPPPPHTLPPLHAIDWYASRPPGSTANVGDVQWCHLVASPGYSETRRKRYSTDSQNCSPPSSESTGPPGSPQEEAVSSSGGDPCHAHQPIPQYHHAHVFQGPHPHAAAYVYPGYLFGPAVYSVNGVPLAATPIHPLHGLSQSIHVHNSAAVAAPAPVSGPQGAVPTSAAPGSDAGSQRRRKKKRRRKRKRGLTDDASEETSSEVGEEEGVNASTGTCGACSGGGSRGEEFDEEDEEEDGPVVVVRLGNVVPLVMSQPPQSMAVSAPSQLYPADAGVGREEDEEANELREGEASSTDCSELSGHPESSSSVSGGEDTVLGEDRATQVDEEDHRHHNLHGKSKPNKVSNGVVTKDAEVSAQQDLPPLDAPQPKRRSEDKDVHTDTETREVSTQSPPEMAVQVNENEPINPPRSPSPLQTHVPEVLTLGIKSADRYDDNNTKECSKKADNAVPGVAEGKPVLAAGKEKQQTSPKEETPKQKRRNGGRGRNNRSVPVIQPIEVPAVEEKVAEPAMQEHAVVEVVVEETEAPEPVQVVPAPARAVTTATPTPVQVKMAPVQVEIKSVRVETTPVEVVPTAVQAAPKQVQVPAPKQVQVPAPKQVQMPATKEPNQSGVVEPRVEPPKTLPLDSFTFKPEPYKHPMLKPTKQDNKEETPLRTESTVREVNGESSRGAEADSMNPKEANKSTPSRHLQDLPRRKSRLKKPPEREQTPGLAIATGDDEVTGEEKTPDEVTTSPAWDEERNVTKETGEFDNKPHSHQQEPENQPEETPNEVPAGDDTTGRIETLTEVVSKWLEENSDALPESMEEIKGEEKTEDEEDEGNLTGSKNGVSNPFPAPSSRLLEAETPSVCTGVNAAECVSVSNVCVDVVRKDGPEKRVANRQFGGDEVKNDYINEEERKNYHRGSSVEEGSCEWEPMTVEAPKRGFTDLESWKRLRGGLGGSPEALRSLGSYRGTDDEDEDEVRKVRLSMCDPSASVAKYYCLGATEIKSPSPEEEGKPKPEVSQPPVPTDSGVQSDEEDEAITTGEEALEDVSNSRKSRPHKTMGLGKTAAFVVRQIGTTDSAKGPFPCGICCIIQ